MGLTFVGRLECAMIIAVMVTRGSWNAVRPKPWRSAMQRVSVARQPAVALILSGLLVIGFTFAESKLATAAGLSGGSVTGSKPPISGSGPGVPKGGRGNSIPGKQAGGGGGASGVPSRENDASCPRKSSLDFGRARQKELNRSISEPLQGDPTRLARLPTDRHKALSLAR